MRKSSKSLEIFSIIFHTPQFRYLKALNRCFRLLHYRLIVILLNFYMCFQKYQRSCCLIEKTLNYIKQNLNADLSLEKIAKTTSYTQKFTRLYIFSRVNFLLFNFYAICQKHAAPLYFKGIIL